MIEESESLYAKLAALEKETASLRLASMDTGRRFADVQVSLQELTALSLTGARCAAAAVDKAVLATKKAASVAEHLAPHVVSGATDLEALIARKAAAMSVEAASAAAQSAVEAAAGAATVARLAAQTAAHQSEKSALLAAATTAAEAAEEGKRAVENAQIAVKLANAVAAFVRLSSNASAT